MSVDELVWCLQQAYPGTQQGVDYWCGHDVDEAFKQIAAARIVMWCRDDIDEPTPEAIKALAAEYGEAASLFVLSREGRWQRDALLLEADKIANRVMDDGTPEQLADVKAYRKALRDVPQQADFPRTVTMPELPSSLSEFVKRG